MGRCHWGPPTGYGHPPPPRRRSRSLHPRAVSPAGVAAWLGVVLRLRAGTNLPPASADLQAQTWFELEPTWPCDCGAIWRPPRPPRLRGQPRPPRLRGQPRPPRPRRLRSIHSNSFHLNCRLRSSHASRLRSSHSNCRSSHASRHRATRATHRSSLRARARRKVRAKSSQTAANYIIN